MGRGSYNASDWNKLKNSRNIDSAKNEKEIFKSQKCDQRFDPRYIQKREARDSEDHPESLPIIIGLDVTASMGYLAEQVAKEALNETMMKLYSTNAVKDPALMFAAYGDADDESPLQVTQFESDIRIAEQLLDLWLENGGRGWVVPSMLWYFAFTVMGFLSLSAVRTLRCPGARRRFIIRAPAAALIRNRPLTAD